MNAAKDMEQLERWQGRSASARRLDVSNCIASIPDTPLGFPYILTLTSSVFRPDQTRPNIRLQLGSSTWTIRLVYDARSTDPLQQT